MKVIRTPDERFENLPDWPFQPRYVVVNDLRMHYVDEGQGETILCLHGEPSWSYLYRKFIPILSPNFRVICPDLIGFGRSDKLVRKEDYSFDMHLDQIIGFVDALDLQDMTLVVQDWGGLIGLGMLGKIPERFSRVVILNTFLPIGEENPSTAFKIWRFLSQFLPGMPVGLVMKMGTYQPMSKEIRDAYKAPFPGNAYKAGAKIFPALVPMDPHNPAVPTMKQARKTLQNWNKPAKVMFSDKDAVLGGGYRWFVENIPKEVQDDYVRIRDAGHFLQEDKGEEIAGHIADFMQRTPHK